MNKSAQINKATANRGVAKENPFLYDIKNNSLLYLMLVPIVAYYIVFCYLPMYGIVIAFKDYAPGLGIGDSPWTEMNGLRHFIEFIKGPYFWRVVGNTLGLSLMDIVFGFPAPILFALLLNEVHHSLFKRVVQTITYVPHFISMVVVCGLLYTFLGRNGFFNDIIVMFGGERTNLLANPDYFKPIYVISGIWQGIGWGSIIYLSALTAIDSSLYEAATIDGAGRFKQILHITIPGIIPTIAILFILRMGSLFSVGFEKVILLYNSQTMPKADVISSFLYRRGLVDSDFSYSTAVGLLNSGINFIVLYLTNVISKKLTENSLW